MRRILLTTLVLGIFGCLVTGSFAAFLESSLQAFLYVALLTFGSIIIPTFLGVLIFQIVRKQIIFSSLTKTFIAQVLTMILIMMLGLVFWAIGDVLIGANEITFESVTHNFHSQFSGFAIGGVFMAIVIPLVDRALSRKYEDK